MTGQLKYIHPNLEPPLPKRTIVKVVTDGLTIRKQKPKIERNDKCFCGSGKKLKHCHLNDVENGYNKIVRKKKANGVLQS